MAKMLPSYIKKHLSLDDLTSSRSTLQFMDTQEVVTQVQTAKAVGLSAGTCNLHFQKLEHMGLIQRVDSVSKSRGRSTILWALEQKKNFCLSLVFDIPFLQVDLVDFSGRVVLERYEDLTDVSGQLVLKKKIDGIMKDVIAYIQDADGHIRKTFVGLPGTLDPTTKKVLNVANFPVLNGMDFMLLMQEQYGLPCYCGSLGLVFYYGGIRMLPPETRTMVIHWDLGVGATAGVGESEILHYSNGLTYFDFGHVRIERDGHLCHCSQRGCLEAYVGGWAMIKALDHPDVQSLDRFMQAVLSGDVDAVRVAKEAAYLLGRNLYWAQQMMHIERLIFSGALSVIFPVVRSSLIKGLSKMFNEQEVAALDPMASTEVRVSLQQGAFQLARRQFFYAE